MPKITIIGAGSMAFIRALVADFTTYPELDGSTLCLMDINADRLAMSKALADRIIQQQSSHLVIEATTDRREALHRADYVLTTFQVGGFAAFEQDIQIPAKYGVSQVVGDTLGPGGIFRGLRHIPVLESICGEMEEACPDAVLLQYANPMAINMWAVARSHPGIKAIGLCHSVPITAARLAGYIGAPYEEVAYRCAGINHNAWFLEFKWNGQDAYPLIRKAAEDPAKYGRDPVRFEMLKHFGYFVTESSAHFSEYVPWFRKRPDLLEQLVTRFTDPGDDWIDWGRTGGYLRFVTRDLETAPVRRQKWISGEVPVPVERSSEFGPRIIHSLETNTPRIIYGNIPNHGLIPNLPEGCCVEVPIHVDGAGMVPTHIGRLPAQLAGIVRMDVSAQELAVEGSLAGDRDLIRQAVALDPLTAAVCSLDEVEAMTRELFAANERWLPQFGR